MEINKYKENYNLPDEYEFRLFHLGLDRTGKKVWQRSVGVAQLVSGNKFYTLRLWTLSNEEYFLVPKDKAQRKYLIYTKVRTRINNSTQKIKWNIVGSGTLDTSIGAAILKFDLLAQPIYLDIYSCKLIKAKVVNEDVA